MLAWNVVLSICCSTHGGLSYEHSRPQNKDKKCVGSSLRVLAVGGRVTSRVFLASFFLLT